MRRDEGEGILRQRICLRRHATCGLHTPYETVSPRVEATLSPTSDVSSLAISPCPMGNNTAAAQD